MPLVVTALDAALDLPAPGAGGAEPPPTVLGRALKRVGAVAVADARNVSRAQIEVRLVSDHLGLGCRVTAVGENPTPWFPSVREGLAGAENGTSEPSKRLLRKGESAVLRDGDGLGLCQTDAPPGALRFQSARAARTLGPEALFEGCADATGFVGVDVRNTKCVPSPVRSTDRATPFTDGRGRDADAAATTRGDEDEKEKDDSKALERGSGAKRARDEGEDPMRHTDHAEASKPLKPIVLVFSGAPGSGKSTFCASLPRDAWVVVNQDTAGKNGKPGTRAQCEKSAKNALATRRNVAIDRCGLTFEQRETFVKLACEHGAEAHALWFDLPKELLFERLKNRTNHPTIKDGGGVNVCKRMLGAKANAPPETKEGFVKVTRCVNERDVERALAGYRRITEVAAVRGGGGGDGVGGTDTPEADGAAAFGSAKPSESPNAPNAFAVMMGAAKEKAKKPASPTPANPPGSVTKQTNASKPLRNVSSGGGSWRDVLSAIVADPAAHAERGAVLFFDDELVVAKDAYPKSRTHLLVLARDVRLAEGPKAMRSSDAPLVRRMMRAGLECARRLVDDERVQFRCGFHAAPSMRTAHMHVVSCDLRGSGMKTRRHWNSFATSFFREAEETAFDLEKQRESDVGVDWDVDELERVVAMTPLRCHKCGDGPFNTMPKLFSHTDACDKEGFSVRMDTS